MSSNRIVDKQTVVYLYNGILYNDKINKLSSHKKAQKNLKHMLLRENSQSEKAIFSMILTI